MQFSAHKTWFWCRHFVVALLLLWVNDRWGISFICGTEDIQRANAGVLAQIGATMMGFALTLVGVLASLGSTRVIRNMQRSGHFNVLLAMLLVTALVFGVLTVVGVAMFMVQSIDVWHVRLLVFFALWSVLLLLDSMMKLWGVISIIHPGGDTLE